MHLAKIVGAPCEFQALRPGTSTAGTRAELLGRSNMLDSGTQGHSDDDPVNPNAKFPVLLSHTCAFSLYESHAIMRFICAEFDSKHLWYPPPDRPMSRALVDQCLDW